MNNKYEVRGDVTAIILQSPKYGMKETIISTIKLDKAKELLGNWRVGWQKGSNSFYVIAQISMVNGNWKTIRLHRWMTNAPDGMVVDHINSDTLNNTDGNLRICTKAENGQNRIGARIDNRSSGIRGVTWHKSSRKWIACIRINRKLIHLGSFADIKEAEMTAMEARAKYMPFSKDAS
jgi:hypothetical protein